MHIRSLCFSFLVFAAASAAETVQVRVTTAAGSPAAGVHCDLVELRRAVDADAEGRCIFEGVPPGRYHVQVRSSRFGSAVDKIEVSADGPREFPIELGLSSHREKVVVTAGPGGRGSAEVVLPVQVMDDTELSEKLQPTLGETLAQEPGVSSSYFGPGSSRPVIRGQGGGRVRVLEGGLGVGDASTTSPDHAVATDVAAADGVEILRGPGTLLYGSTAVGGVVNVLDRRIPDHVPAGGTTGSLQLRLASGSEEKSGAFALTGGRRRFAWHVDGSHRDTDDYDIAEPAVLDDPDSPSNTLPNSSLETSSATLGVSWVGERGFFGVSVRGVETNYGIPAELEDEGGDGLPAPEEEGVRIDLEHRRLDLRGALRGGLGPFDEIRFSAGATDYEHAELEGAAVGTRFFSDTLEGRVELSHGGGSAWSGVVGAQFRDVDAEAIGAEAFLPRAETTSLALFALEEWRRDRLRYELGLRVETTDVSTPQALAADPLCRDPRDRSFDTVSGSFGLLLELGERYAIGGSVSRAVRPPSGEELLSCGEHVATLSFEVGDPDLGTEASLGVDVGLRRRSGVLTGEVNLFRYRYDDFIYEFDTGATAPPGAGLPVFRFTQADAEFTGFELTGVVALSHGAGRDVDLELGGDYVRAELTDGEPLPRIPPARLRAGIRFRGPRWHAAAQATRFFAQDRVTSFETPTASYTRLAGHVGYRRIAGALVHDVSLRVSNLLDEGGRSHSSRLKDLVPLPGRDLALVYRLLF